MRYIILALCVLVGCQEQRRPVKKPKLEPRAILVPIDPPQKAEQEPIVMTAPANVVDAIQQILGGDGEFPNKKPMTVDLGEGATLKVPVGLNFTYSIQADGSYLFVMGRPKPEVSVKSMRWLIEPPVSSVLIKRNNSGLAKVDMPGGITYTHKFKLDWDAAPEETSNAPLPKEQPVASAKKTVVLITMEKCVPCDVAHVNTIPKLKEAGIEVEEINLSTSKKDVSSLGVDTCPTFILYDGESEIGRIVGQNPVVKGQGAATGTNPTLVKILDLFNKRKKSQ